MVVETDYRAEKRLSQPKGGKKEEERFQKSSKFFPNIWYIQTSKKNHRYNYKNGTKGRKKGKETLLRRSNDSIPSLLPGVEKLKERKKKIRRFFLSNPLKVRRKRKKHRLENGGAKEVERRGGEGNRCECVVCVGGEVGHQSIDARRRPTCQRSPEINTLGPSRLVFKALALSSIQRFSSSSPPSPPYPPPPQLVSKLNFNPSIADLTDGGKGAGFAVPRFV